MSNTANYIERDLSWMYFNQRILAEAKRADLPLLERINMLGIYSNNLDEYFKVRVAALSDKSDKDLLDTIGKMNAEMSVDFRNTIHSLNDCLRKEGIFMVRDYDITEGQKCDFLTPKQQENFRDFIKDYCLKISCRRLRRYVFSIRISKLLVREEISINCINLSRNRIQGSTTFFL